MHTVKFVQYRNFWLQINYIYLLLLGIVNKVLDPNKASKVGSNLFIT